MKDVFILENLKVNMEMERVLHAIDCAPDSPVYEEIMEEYLDICEDMLALAQPRGILGMGSLSEAAATEEYPAGTQVIYAVLSIGDGIRQCSTRAFSEGDYVRGMLCDAMADNLLFSMEEQLLGKLREICAEHKLGVLKRLEAPHDIPMEVQKDAWECLKLKERFGIDITCGYMFDPVKTSCQVFVLTEDEKVFRAQHDCRKCPNVSCKYRDIPEEVIPEEKAEWCENRGTGVRGAESEKIAITIKAAESTSIIYVLQKESLMDALLREGYYISAVCGGTGRCGKCKVRVLQGQAAITAEDNQFFSVEELSQGWRLSCMLYPTEKLTIAFEQEDEPEFEVVSAYADKGQVAEQKEKTTDEIYEIAIDIGTTTLAFQLLDKADGRIINTVTTVNSQRKYGADVVSRMQSSINGKKDELQDAIREDLQSGIRKLLERKAVEEYGEASIAIGRIHRIAIGCNTTMGHLLLGYDCDSLGVYPFTPVNIELIKGGMQEILGMDGNAEVIILPGISTYVGGDIVAGLYACDFHKSDEICLLVDLGTNGEMALGNAGKIIVTSTAAGPAFEGGNISWGMGSVAGAVCSVKLEDGKAQVQTIRDKSPVGICGTGVVEAVAELLRAQLLDETGLLDEEYFDDGFPLAQTTDGKTIVITQKDIRELQLAKAAVRAGVETLLLRYGIEKEQVAKVYLAGGFGYRLDTAKAIAIGMLPEEFADRIQAVGNSCLAGVVKYLQEERGAETMQQLVQISHEINLSNDKDFNETYMEAMMFDNGNG